VAERKSILLRLDPSVHDALARWAAAELRSTNAQIEFLLRKALADRGLLPPKVGEIRRPGRPPAPGEPAAQPGQPEPETSSDHPDPADATSARQGPDKPED
jgi:hypothetical protein